MARLAFAPFLRVFKDNGDVCPDATATWYLAGTTTLTDTYTTSSLGTPNTNPVAASALGIFPAMWLADGIEYKVKIQGTGVTTQTIDYVYSTASLDQLSGDRRYVGLAGGAAYVTTGSSNAYVVTTGLSTGSLNTYETLLIKPNHTNTGAATLNVDGIGAKTILRNGLPLRSGELVSGRIYALTYDGTQFQIATDAREADNSGYLFGLTLSNNGSDATNDIDIAAGSAIDSTAARMLVLASGITKQLDAAWAVGTNAGGLDTGSIANTTYHVWLIMRSDTGVVDVLFSTSASSPTMPTNYDYKRRIGSIMRSGAAIRLFKQVDDVFLHNDATTGGILDVNANTTGTSAVSRTLSVPVGIVCEAIINLTVNGAGGACNTSATSLDTPDIAPAANVGILTIAPSAGVGSVQGRVRTNTSAQIRTRATASGATITQQIGTIGWIDTRGRLS